MSETRYDFDQYRENNSTGVFEEIRNRDDSAIVTLEELREQTLAEAESNNNYWEVLGSDTERVKADVDNDRVITYDEYRNYLLSKEPVATSTTPRQNIHENFYDTHHYYHLDTSFLIGIGMICITAILIAFIRK